MVSVSCGGQDILPLLLCYGHLHWSNISATLQPTSLTRLADKLPTRESRKKFLSSHQKFRRLIFFVCLLQIWWSRSLFWTCYTAVCFKSNYRQKKQRKDPGKTGFFFMQQEKALMSFTHELHPWCSCAFYCLFVDFYQVQAGVFCLRNI